MVRFSAVFCGLTLACNPTETSPGDEGGELACDALPCEAELVHTTSNVTKAYDVLRAADGALYWSAGGGVRRYAPGEATETAITSDVQIYAAPLVVDSTVYAVTSAGIVSVPVTGGEETLIVSNNYVRAVAHHDGSLFWGAIDTLFQGDPVTGQIAVETPVGLEPTYLAAGDEYVYVHHAYGQSRYHHPSGDLQTFFAGSSFIERPVVANEKGAAWYQGRRLHFRPHGSDEVLQLVELAEGRSFYALHADLGGVVWSDDRSEVFRYDLTSKETVRVTESKYASSYVAITSDADAFYLMTADGEIVSVPRVGVD